MEQWMDGWCSDPSWAPVWLCAMCRLTILFPVGPIEVPDPGVFHPPEHMIATPLRQAPDLTRSIWPTGLLNLNIQTYSAGSLPRAPATQHRRIDGFLLGLVTINLILIVNF